MSMNDKEYKAFLSLLMCSDPWPVEPDKGEQELLKSYANQEVVERGYFDWIEALHKM